MLKLSIDAEGKIKFFGTHAVNSINKRIVTTVTHRQPMAAEKDDIDVAVSETKSGNLTFFPLKGHSNIFEDTQHRRGGETNSLVIV